MAQSNQAKISLNNNNLPVSNRNKHPTHIPYDPHLHRNSKPPYSFSCLIFMAIEDSPVKALPVKEVYAWILDHFPYFRNAPTGWKNSVRHNLSLNKCFRKVEKAPVSFLVIPSASVELKATKSFWINSKNMFYFRIWARARFGWWTLSTVRISSRHCRVHRFHLPPHRIFRRPTNRLGKALVRGFPIPYSFRTCRKGSLPAISVTIPRSNSTATSTLPLSRCSRSNTDL